MHLPEAVIGPWLLLDARVVDCTRSYHPIVASRILLEVRMFQGPDKSVERCRRPSEPKTLASTKSHTASGREHAMESTPGFRCSPLRSRACTR